MKHNWGNAANATSTVSLPKLPSTAHQANPILPCASVTDLRSYKDAQRKGWVRRIPGERREEARRALPEAGKFQPETREVRRIARKNSNHTPSVPAPSGPLPGPTTDSSSDTDVDDTDVDDTASAASDNSEASRFSFQREGRNASIRYYKSKDQVQKEQETKQEQKNVENFKQFINSSEPLDQLDDDLNYIDLDEQDETDDLFNRNLFSDDDMDDYNDGLEQEAQPPVEAHPPVGLSNRPSIKTNRLSMQFATGDESHGVLDRELSSPTSLQSTASAAATSITKDPATPPPTNPSGQIMQLLNQLNRVPQSTTSNEESALKGSPRDRRHSKQNRYSQISRSSSQDSQSASLAARSRVNSLKYHQISPSVKEDNLDVIKSKYSWLPNDSESKNGGSPGVGNSSFDNSVLDEINEIPEEFDYESPVQGQDPGLAKLAEPIAATEMIPGGNTGNRINLSGKTITLFHQPPTHGRTRPYYADLLYSANHNSSKDDYYDDEDELSFIPNNLSTDNLGESSFLTTITEASYEDSQSFNSMH